MFPAFFLYFFKVHIGYKITYFHEKRKKIVILLTK